LPRNSNTCSARFGVLSLGSSTMSGQRSSIGVGGHALNI
jgi:hypothetical protein